MEKDIFLNQLSSKKHIGRKDDYGEYADDDDDKEKESRGLSLIVRRKLEERM